MVDKGAQYLRQKAERYRTLARAALDQYTTQALLKLATEYEARAAEAESATAVTLRSRRRACYAETERRESRGTE